MPYMLGATIKATSSELPMTGNERTHCAAYSELQQTLCAKDKPCFNKIYGISGHHVLMELNLALRRASMFLSSSTSESPLGCRLRTSTVFFFGVALGAGTGPALDGLLLFHAAPAAPAHPAQTRWAAARASASLCRLPGSAAAAAAQRSHLLACRALDRCTPHTHGMCNFLQTTTGARPETGCATGCAKSCGTQQTRDKVLYCQGYLGYA